MDITDKDMILMLAGAAIGFVVAWLFYWLSSKSLTKEAARLRKLHELTLYAYFNRDAKVRPRYDAHGNMVGIIVEAAGNAAGTSRVRGKSKLDALKSATAVLAQEQISRS